MEPTTSARRFDVKKDPCPQSCWKMNNRMRRKASGTASASVSA